MIDATETPIGGQKKQKHYYSGKKKRHALKSQVVVDKKQRRLFAQHFQMESVMILDCLTKTYMHPAIKAITDTGYPGIQKIHNKSECPKSEAKKSPLSKEDKEQNQKLASHLSVLRN